MKIRSNWILALAAAALTAYVWLVERRAGALVTGPGGATATFAPIAAEEITGLELASSNRVLAIHRLAAGGTWSIRLPFETAAEPSRIESLTRALGNLRPSAYLGANDVAAAGGLRAFGLESPASVRLTLKADGRPPVILNFGDQTFGGSRLYLQRVGSPGLFVVDRGLADSLPKSVDDWRHRALLALPIDGFDRLELKGSTEFRAERDPSGNWRLKRPLDARANSERLNSLIALLAQARIEQFVSDRPLLDLEAYELQRPVADLILGRGAENPVHLWFGGLVTNDPTHRYVLRLTTTNLVTVPASLVELLQQPLAAYRDRRLLPDVSTATRLEFQGTTNQTGFILERPTPGSTNWMVTAPRRFPADPSVMAYFLWQFSQFEIADFPADVVTDLGRYGLDRPKRSYQISSGTNLLALLQLGTPLPENPVLLHARRSDEASIYALPRSVLGQLPEAAAQLRDWRFSPTNVTRIVVEQRGQSGTFSRTNGGWNGPRGRLDSILAGNLEATLSGVGALRSNRFAVNDPVQEAQLRKIYHLNPEAGPIALTIHLRPDSGANFSRWQLEFGGELGAARVALAHFDDDPIGLRVEIPVVLFEDVLRDFAW